MVSFLSDATLIKLSFVLFPALVLGFVFDLTPSWKKRVVEYPFLLFSGLICLIWLALHAPLLVFLVIAGVFLFLISEVVRNDIAVLRGKGIRWWAPRGKF